MGDGVILNLFGKCEHSENEHIIVRIECSLNVGIIFATALQIL